MSNMNGGEFFMFIRGCWHNLTTLSIIFHDLSIVFRSTVTRRWEPPASANAPWIKVISFWLIFGDVVVALFVDLAAAIRLTTCCKVSATRFKPPTTWHFLVVYTRLLFRIFFPVRIRPVAAYKPYKATSTTARWAVILYSSTEYPYIELTNPKY